MTKSDLPQFSLKPGSIERPDADWSRRVVDGPQVKRLVGPGVERALGRPVRDGYTTRWLMDDDLYQWVLPQRVLPGATLPQ